MVSSDRAAPSLGSPVSQRRSQGRAVSRRRGFKEAASVNFHQERYFARFFGFSVLCLVGGGGVGGVR